MKNEAAKYGYTLEQAMEICCERGWQGFRGAWNTDKQSASEQRLNQMSALTRGLATPKSKPFWSKKDEVTNVEPTRLL